MENKTEIEQLSQNLKIRRKQQAKKEINELISVMKESKINNVIPEIVFKEYFLDYFKDIQFHNENENHATLIKWAEVAGTLYNEVDVLDNNGNVLYTVPPVFQRPKIDENIAGNTSFNTIVNKYSLKSGRLAVEGENYLTAELSKLNGIVANDSNQEVRLRWQAIFDRYRDGRFDTEPVQGNSIPEPKKKDATDEADIYDFD